jgi:hypothetical protein
LDYEVTARGMMVRCAFAVGGMIMLYEVAVGNVSGGSEVADGGMMVRCGVAMGGVILRAGLAAVNVVQSAYTYNAVQAITNALMAATPVSLVVLAIAALAAGFVLAYNKLKPFHDAVNTAFVLLQELWSWLPARSRTP